MLGSHSVGCSDASSYCYRLLLCQICFILGGQGHQL